MTRLFNALAMMVTTLALVHAATAAELPKLERGINLARLHSLPMEDPEKAGAFLWPPFQGPLAEISDGELDALWAAGFDFIRLPVAPAPFLAASEPEQRLLIDALYDTVKRLQDVGFAVLVDPHPNHHDPNWSAPLILADPDGAAFSAYAEWLQQLARYMASLPPEQTALGLMNEPQEACFTNSSDDWTVRQPLLYRFVRDVAPELAVVLTTGCYSAADALPQLDMTPYDKNTFIDVHYYRPYMFTHQGLPFANMPTRFLAGLAYPGTDADQDLTLARTEALINERRNAGDYVPDDIVSEAEGSISHYYNDPPIVDETYIPGHFQAMQDWVANQDLDPARLIVGEFGVTRSPEGMDDIPGRNEWIRDVRTAAESHGFGWAYWDYNAGDGYTGFGLVFDNEARAIDPEMLQSLGLDATSTTPR